MRLFTIIALGLALAGCNETNEMSPQTYCDSKHSDVYPAVCLKLIAQGCDRATADRVAIRIAADVDLFNQPMPRKIECK